MATINFNTIAKYSLGALIGAGIAYLLVDHFYVNRRSDDIIEEPKEELPEGKLVIIENEFGEVSQGLVPTSKEKKVRPARVIDYSKIAEKLPLNELVKKHIEENLKREPVVEQISKPYVLPEDVYMESTFEKVTLTYYEGDDTLCDDQEVIIPEVTDLLGEEALVSFGVKSEDPDIVYIRNEKRGTDYEVVRVKKSYSVEVLQLEPPKKPRRNRVKKVSKIDDNAENEED